MFGKCLPIVEKQVDLEALLCTVNILPHYWEAEVAIFARVGWWTVSVVLICHGSAKLQGEGEDRDGSGSRSHTFL